MRKFLEWCDQFDIWVADRLPDWCRRPAWSKTLAAGLLWEWIVVVALIGMLSLMGYRYTGEEVDRNIREYSNQLP